MSRPKKPRGPLVESNLQALLDHLGIADNDWDVFIVGDGSGCSWNMGCGWGAIVIDHYLTRRKELFGAMNCGTVYLAELMPCLHALSWYHEGPAKNKIADMQKRGVIRPIRVHILTDSEIVCKQGTGDCRKKAGRGFWEAIEAFKEYRITWHWMDRDSTALNMLVDHLSRESRVKLCQVKVPEGTTIYDYNPF